MGGDFHKLSRSAVLSGIQTESPFCGVSPAQSGFPHILILQVIVIVIVFALELLVIGFLVFPDPCTGIRLDACFIGRRILRVFRTARCERFSKFGKVAFLNSYERRILRTARCEQFSKFVKLVFRTHMGLLAA